MSAGPFAVPVKWLAVHSGLLPKISECKSCCYSIRARLPDALESERCCLYSFKRHIEGGICRDFL